MKYDAGDSSNCSLTIEEARITLQNLIIIIHSLAMAIYELKIFQIWISSFYFEAN